MSAYTIKGKTYYGEDTINGWKKQNDLLRARVAHWIRVTPSDTKPPIGVPVRVVWPERGKSDPKRAVWTGQYWATARRTGQYECGPDWWLYEPPLPDPPTV